MTNSMLDFANTMLVIGLVLAPSIAHAEPQKYALVIGIKDYPEFERKPQLAGRKLKYADHDADEFAKFIKSHAGGDFPPAHVRVLVNEQATRTAIVHALRWLHDAVRPEDEVFVFFSGHGVPDMYGRAFFMPSDADPEYPEDRGIRADELLRSVKDQISPKHLVFFIDACFAGAASVTEASTKAAWQQFDWKTELEGAPSVAMAFLSATNHQMSYEDDEFKQGVFSYFLLRGLRGAADEQGNNDGKVTAGELKQYLETQVQRSVQSRYNQRQVPTVTTDYEPDFTLAVQMRSGMPAPTEFTTVADALLAFRVAYMSRDADKLVSVCPSIDPTLYEQIFHDYTQITINPSEPLIKEDKDTRQTTVDYKTYELLVTPDGGRQQRFRFRAAFKLNHGDSGWVIEHVSLDKLAKQ